MREAVGWHLRKRKFWRHDPVPLGVLLTAAKEPDDGFYEAIRNNDIKGLCALLKI
jgi:hypothetical protein